MPLDGFVFTSLLRELRPNLINAIVRQVTQLDGETWVLRLSHPDEDVSLVISTHPDFPSLHLTRSDRHRDAQGIDSSFLQSLRQALIPGRVTDIRQRPFDRIVNIDVEGRDDEGQKMVRTVTVELIGQACNVILSYRSTGQIIDVLKKGGGQGSLSYTSGETYVPPEITETIHPITGSFETFDRALRLEDPDKKVSRILVDQIMGVSPFAAREVLARSNLSPHCIQAELDVETRRLIWNNINAVAFAAEGVSREDDNATASAGSSVKLVPTRVVPKDGRPCDFWHVRMVTIDGVEQTFASVSHMLEHIYHDRRQRHELDQVVRQLRAVCRKHIKRLEKKASLQRQAVEDGAHAETYKRHADLIMAQLHLVAAKTDVVTLPDLFADGEPVRIQLDPTKTPIQNANAYYSKYQKAKKTVVQAQKQLDATVEELTYVRSIQQMIDMAETPEDTAEIREELTQAGYIDDLSAQTGKGSRSGRSGATPASTPLQFRSTDGLTIYVGRNNRQNDKLTMRQARPDDFWLHVKDLPGAHVIVKSEGRPTLPEKTLWEAAQLAAYYSHARSSAKVAVDVTERRHVRKPKGARPGMVLYENERTVYVTPDKDVIANLR